MVLLLSSFIYGFIELGNLVRRPAEKRIKCKMLLPHTRLEQPNQYPKKNSRNKTNSEEKTVHIPYSYIVYPKPSMWRCAPVLAAGWLLGCVTFYSCTQFVAAYRVYFAYERCGTRATTNYNSFMASGRQINKFWEERKIARKYEKKTYWNEGGIVMRWRMSNRFVDTAVRLMRDRDRNTREAFDDKCPPGTWNVFALSFCGFQLLSIPTMSAEPLSQDLLRLKMQLNINVCK